MLMDKAIIVVRPDPGGAHTEIREEFPLPADGDIEVSIKTETEDGLEHTSLMASRLVVNPQRGKATIIRRDDQGVSSVTLG